MAAATATAGAPVTRADYTEYSGPVRWIILVAVMLGTILEVLDTSIVNVAIPDMMGNLGATIDQIGWVSTGYILANVIILPLTGWLSNQFGRRNYLVGSIILFTVASLLCGTATSLNQLVMYRILQGAGGAALLSTAQATLLEVFPPKQVPMVQAIFTMGVVAAPTLGPTLGGYITNTYSWPWIFFINIPIGIIAAVMVFMFLRDSRYQGPKKSIDLIGIGLLAVGLGCLQTVLEKGNREGWLESNLIVQLGVIAVAALSTFVWWELRIEDPAVNLRILKNRGFTAGAIYGFVLGFGLYGGVFILPIFLQNVRQYTATQTGLVLMPGGFLTAACLPFIGKAVRKYQPRVLVGLGTICFAGSMYIMHTMTNSTGPDELLASLLLRGVALSLMFLPLTLSTLYALTPREVPYGTGLFNLTRQLGGSMGIAVLSTILDHRTSMHRAQLVEHITSYNPVAVARIQSLTQAMIAKGASVDVARHQALEIIDRIVGREATILSFDDCFLIITAAFVLALPLLLLFKKAKTSAPVPMDAH